VRQRAAAGRIEGRHHVGTAAERTERHPAGEVLAERGEVGDHPVAGLGAAGAHSRRHHLVEDEQRPDRVASRAEGGEEVDGRRDATGGTHHRLDQDGGDIAVDRAAQCGDVVERDAAKDERREQRLAAVSEVEQAAVIGAVGDDDHVAARVVPRELDRHQVGLGARVGEPHLIDRREAGTHGLGEANLVDVDAAVAPPALERATHCGGYR
jgi:hypothetical protein